MIAKVFMLKLLVAVGSMLMSILILAPVDYWNGLQEERSELVVRLAGKNASVVQRNNQAKGMQQDVSVLG
jgi:hypothetical protein